MKKDIVMDANILFRATLGNQVPELLNRYQAQNNFFTPAYCYGELRKHLPRIAKTKNLPIEPFYAVIEKLEQVVIPLPAEIYAHWENEAKERIQERDVNDWPIIALSLALNCPIWTEDQDFFGTGISTWNSRNVEIYLSSKGS